MNAATPDFAKLVPGFDFLQGLVKNAGSVLPNIGQWVAPTLNPEELEKRIEELRTVQFWLEQNARMLGATIQALEVQRMTLSTLKTMNVQVADLRESLRIKLPDDEPATEEPDTPDDEPAEAPAAKKPAAPRARARPAAAPVSGIVDPTQWWGALTKQFTQLAASTMKDVASDSAKQLTGNLVKQSFDAAEQTIKVGMAPARKAAEMAGGVANRAARAASGKAAAKPAAAKKKAAPARKAAARRR